MFAAHVQAMNLSFQATLMAFLAVTDTVNHLLIHLMRTRVLHIQLPFCLSSTQHKKYIRSNIDASIVD